MKQVFSSLLIAAFTLIASSAFSSNNVDCTKKNSGGLKSASNHSRFLPQETESSPTQQAPQGIVK